MSGDEITLDTIKEGAGDLLNKGLEMAQPGLEYISDKTGEYAGKAKDAAVDKVTEVAKDAVENQIEESLGIEGLGENFNFNGHENSILDAFKNAIPAKEDMFKTENILSAVGAVISFFLGKKIIDAIPLVGGGTKSWVGGLAAAAFAFVGLKGMLSGEANTQFSKGKQHYAPSNQTGVSAQFNQPETNANPMEPDYLAIAMGKDNANTADANISGAEIATPVVE